MNNILNLLLRCYLPDSLAAVNRHTTSDAMEVYELMPAGDPAHYQTTKFSF